MRLAVAFTLSLTCIAMQEKAAPTLDRAALQALIGEWKYVSMITDGRQIDMKRYEKQRLVIAQDGSFLVRNEDNVMVRGRLTFLHGQGPLKELDRTIAGVNEFNGKFWPEYKQVGISELEGKKWRLCITLEDRGQGRPKEFASPAGKELVLEELERVK